MEKYTLIESNKLKYNINIDAGDNLSNILLNKNTILPTINNISFIIPEIDEDYIIKIIFGDNELSLDNIILDIIPIKIETKKIFLEIKINLYYIFITINTKTNTIYKNILLFNQDNYNIDYLNKIIDINYYKLQFEINQIIKIIRKKIKLNYIILDEIDKQLLEDKFNNIIDKVNNKKVSNQKILDVKNNLKQQFFID
jgi:hypothetical protein